MLDAPGLQPLRKELLEAAVSYYKDFAEQRQNEPELQADLAAAHLRLATILSSLDRNDDAVVEFQQGLEQVDQLVQQRGGDTEFPKRLAGFLKASGTFYQQTQVPANPAKVIRTLNRAIEIWEQFVRDYPDVVEFRGDLAGMYALVAALQEPTDLDQALANALRARTLLEKVVHDRPAVVAYQDLLVLVYSQFAYPLETTGRSQEGAEVRREAVRYFTNLAREFPKEFTVRRSLATVQQKLAGSLREAQPREAEQLYRQSLALLESLVAESPRDGRCRQALIATYQSLADVLRQVGSNDEADELIQKEVAVRGQLFTDFPHLLEQQLTSDADRLGAMGNALAAKGDHAKAMEAYGQAILILEKLAADFPGDRNRRRWNLGHAYRLLASQLWDPGRTHELEQALRAAVTAFEKLSADEPSSASYRHFAADTWRQLGHALKGTGRPEQAEQAFRRAVEIQEKRAAELPDQTVNHAEVAACYADLAALLSALADRDPAEAEKLYRRALELYEGLLTASPSVSVPMCFSRWSTTQGALADLLAKTGRQSESEAQKLHAAQFMRRLERDNPGEELDIAIADSNFNRAKSLSESGQYQQALPLFQKAAAVYERAAEKPTRRRVRFLLGHCYRCMDGVENNRKAVAIFAQLAKEDPLSERYQGCLFWAEWGLGDSLTKEKDFTAAESSYRHAIELDQQLAANYPASRQHLADLARVRESYGDMLAAAGRAEEAVAAHCAAKEIYVQLKKDSPQKNEEPTKHGDH